MHKKHGDVNLKKSKDIYEDSLLQKTMSVSAIQGHKSKLIYLYEQLTTVGLNKEADRALEQFISKIYIYTLFINY